MHFRYSLVCDGDLDSTLGDRVPSGFLKNIRSLLKLLHSPVLLSSYTIRFFPLKGDLVRGARCVLERE